MRQKKKSGLKNPVKPANNDEQCLTSSVTHVTAKIMMASQDGLKANMLEMISAKRVNDAKLELPVKLALYCS